MMALAGTACTLALNWPLFETGWEARWLRWLLLQPSEAPNLALPPAWSLTFELTFYVAFAGLFFVPVRWGIGVLASWGIAVLAVAATRTVMDNAYAALALNPLVLEFLFGCAVAAMVRSGATRAGVWMIGVGIIGFVTGAVATGSQEQGSGMGRVIGFGLPAGCLVYGLVACELRGGRAAPRWLCSAGDASYSIYLWHYPAGILCLVFGVYLPHGRATHWLWLIATLVICIGGGFVLHHAVERPLMRLTRRERRSPAAAEPAVLRRAA